MGFSFILAGIALALLLAVLLLELSKPKKRAVQGNDSEVQVYFNKELASEERLPADYSTAEAMIVFQARLSGVQKKTEMAHSRINDLEQELVSAKSAESVEETKLIPFEKRLETLDNFRANTEIEIKALKEIIASQMSPGASFRENDFERQKRQDEEFLHNSVYNHPNRNGQSGKRN